MERRVVGKGDRRENGAANVDKRLTRNGRRTTDAGAKHTIEKLMARSKKIILKDRESRGPRDGLDG